jgi:hypothetical protein
MKIFQSRWTRQEDWQPPLPKTPDKSVQWALVFGSTEVLGEKKVLEQIRPLYPGACFFGCSTAGEIGGMRVTDDSLVLTAVNFKQTRLQSVSTKVKDGSESFDAGRKLASLLEKDGLVHVLVLSNGLKINGSELVKGLVSVLPKEVGVTGGLAGDGARFQRTFVLTDGAVEDNAIAAVGFYGDHLKVGYGSLGGWDPFGPERLITRSSGNVLYELDGKSALDLYKKYLGDHAKDLPASGLLFPLSLKISGHDTPVVRTILSVNEADHSMTFAGDMPQGATARLMKANFDRLIEGAVGAAKNSRSITDNPPPGLALLISCVGRKLILKQRIEEEVEGVRDILGADTVLTGFYSYGEISPFTPGAKCELHNQTMTITTFWET